MKSFVKVLVAVVLVLVLGVSLYQFISSREKGIAPQKLSFPEALEKADRMEVTAAGLGKIERSKIIDGRLYQNFVQILRVGLLYEHPQDTLESDCKEGAYITLYRGADSLDRFRFTTAFNREGSVGYWSTPRLHKINKFLKDVGVPFRGCKIESDMVTEKSEKTEVMTVPKFKKRHGKRDADFSEIQYEVDRDGNVFELGDSVKKQVAVTMELLNELIFPADTALGTPLSELVRDCNRAEVIFNCNEDCKKEVRVASKKVVLDSVQLAEFKKMLLNPTFETFAGSTVSRAETVITLYKDSAEVLELWTIGSGFGNIDKHQRDKDFDRGGAWYKKEPKDLDAFFAPIKAAAFE